MDYYFGHTVTILLKILSAIRNYIRTIILVLKIPGPPALPFLGNVLLAKDHKGLLELGTNVSQRYGSLARGWISFLPVLAIYEPRHLKVILSTNKNNQKGFFYKALYTFLGQGLITSNGYQWKKNRKMIQPYFHNNILEKFLENFIECSDRFISKLEGKKTVKITPFLNECVLDILHNSILGVPLDMDSPYRKGHLQFFDRFVRPWLILESIYSWTSSACEEKNQKHSLESYTKEIVINRRKGIKKPTKTCFLDMFIEIAEKNAEFTEEDIINEAVTFMLAGQDSVGGTLAFTLYFIAKYPYVQERIIKEISLYDVNTKITSKELHEMKYLEQVIKESLRLTPTIPIITRVLNEDITLDDKIIPSGTNLLLVPFSTHRLPEFYPDPLKFDPDRFEEGKIEKLHPYAFLPFSLGPRNCIGYKLAIMEIKTLIFYFLKKYEIKLPPGKEQINLSYRATLRASGGVWITLNSRT